MLAYFGSYFFCLLHPIQAFKAYLGEEKFSESKIFKLTLTESILISWCFNIGNALISLLIYILIFRDLDSFIPEEVMALTSPNIRSYMTPKTLFVLNLVQNILFFPIMTYITIKFLALIVRTFAAIMGESPTEKDIDSIFTIALSSHFLSLVPTLGNLFQTLIFTVYYFIGVRKILGCPSWVAFIVVVTPYILFMFALMALITLVVSLIS